MQAPRRQDTGGAGQRRHRPRSRGRPPPGLTSRPTLSSTDWGAFGSPSRIARTAKAIHAVEGLFRVGGVPWSGARVDVVGRVGGEPRTLTFTTVDKMGRLTGIPTAIGAAMLARKEITTPGVFAPESILDPARFFASLAERDVVVHEPAPRRPLAA